MYECPVCECPQALLPFEYEWKWLSRGEVRCRNCAVPLHRPRRWQSALVILPFLVYIATGCFNGFPPAATNWLALALCALAMLGIAALVTRYVPADPKLLRPQRGQ